LTYANAELANLERDGEEGSRVVVVGEHFVALVPYWAFWPYETLVIPYK
jgi:UDPglucose--hexose-1-phosphate uridylyltransferase